MAERDDELEEYLGGRSKLSRAWRDAGDEEPDADLDEVIVEAARRKVRRGPRVAYSPFSRSWRVPLALAAVLVVSLTVTLVMHEESGEPPPVPVNGPTAAPQAAPGAPSVAAPASGEKPMEQKPLLPAPREHARPDSREREATPREAAPLSASPAASSFAPEPAARQQAAPSAPATLLEGKDAAAKAARAKTEDAGRGDEMSPEEWLARIEKLRREGKEAEAEALLAEFRKRYPDYPLQNRSR